MPENVTEPEKYLSNDFSNRLKFLGFDPGCPVYEVGLDFEDKVLEAALFQSTYSNPYLLRLEVTDRLTESIENKWPLPMVVESVQAVYLPYAVHLGETPTGCHELPEWFVRGFLYKSGFDPYAQVVRMNLYMQTSGRTRNFDKGYLQVVRNPSVVNPEAPLTWGWGAPGQPE